MDDLIIVLITVVIMVVGAVGQLKKKKQAPVTESHESEDAGKIDFWDEFLGQKQAEPQFASEAIPVKETLKHIEPENKIQPPINPPVNYSINKQNIKMGESGESNKSIKIEVLKNKSKIPEGFSLRKAVIFSEIIKPKYF